MTYPETCGKGQRQGDGSYLYTCNACQGTGEADGICVWCYGLDTEKIIEEIKKGARGQRYYALLKAFLSVQGKAMVDEARRLQDLGKFTYIEIGYISLKFGLNFKATCEWLEETQTIASGIYDNFQSNGWKVKDLNEQVHKKYGV